MTSHRTTGVPIPGGVRRIRRERTVPHALKAVGAAGRSGGAKTSGPVAIGGWPRPGHSVGSGILPVNDPASER